MSKEVISQIMEQTCDVCGKKVQWELVGADSRPDVLFEMQKWFQVGRKAVGPDGQLVQLGFDACSLDCVPTGAVKLTLPKFDEPTDNIDLASLRMGGITN